MIRLQEYAPQELDLAPEDLRALVALCRGAEETRVIRAVVPVDSGRHVVTPGSYVGRFRLPTGELVEIGSRLDFADLYSVVANAVGAPALLRDDVIPAEERDGLVDLVALVFAEAVETIVGYGLPKGYVTRRFTRPPFPGAPDVPEQLRRHGGRPDRLVTRARRLTTDIPVNQVLAVALDLLKSAPLRRTTVRRRLEAVRPAFAAVSRRQDRTAAIREARPRLPARCRSAFEAALVVFRGTTALPAAMSGAGAAVLFSMPAVWEDYVEHVLYQELPPGHRLRSQVSIELTDEESPLLGYADLVQLDAAERPVTIIDAKYKAVGRSPSTEDLYQVFAYAHRLGVKQTVLAHPGIGEKTVHTMGPVRVEQWGLPVLRASLSELQLAPG